MASRILSDGPEQSLEATVLLWKEELTNYCKLSSESLSRLQYDGPESCTM